MVAALGHSTESCREGMKMAPPSVGHSRYSSFTLTNNLPPTQECRKHPTKVFCS